MVHGISFHFHNTTFIIRFAESMPTITSGSAAPACRFRSPDLRYALTVA